MTEMKFCNNFKWRRGNLLERDKRLHLPGIHGTVRQEMCSYGTHIYSLSQQLELVDRKTRMYCYVCTFPVQEAPRGGGSVPPVFLLKL